MRVGGFVDQRVGAGGWPRGDPDRGFRGSTEQSPAETSLHDVALQGVWVEELSTPEVRAFDRG